MRFRVPFALAALLAASPVAGAQEPDSTTGRGPGVAVPTAGDTLTGVLSPVTVTVERELSAPPPVVTLEVDPDELRRTQAANPYDLLRRVTGVEVHDHGQGPGFAPNVVIRGFTSDHSSDVLLTVDGVPINLPVNGHQEGYADWYLLLPAAVSSMRVISGTASPLHGDFALGGVIEVFTAADAEGTSAALEGTSERDLAGWVRTGFRREGGGALAVLELERGEGWRDNADLLLGNGLLRGWRRVGDGRLEGGLELYSTAWDSPGFVSVERFNEGDLERAADLTDGGDAWRAILHGRYAKPLSDDLSLEATAWGQASRSSAFLNVPEDGEVRQTDEEDRRVGAGGQAQLAWQPAVGDVTVGASGRVESAEFRLYETEARERLSTEQAFDAGYATGAAFARYRRSFGERLGLDLGGRVDVLRHSTRDRLVEDAGREAATRTVASPKLGARYRLTSATALVASLSRGFRSAPGVIADPDLPPLVAWSGEVGVEHASDPLRLHAAAFRLDVDHERIQDPVTREIASTGGSVRQGLEAHVTFRPLEPVWLTAAFTFNDARISGDGVSAAAEAETVSGRVAAPATKRGGTGGVGGVLAHLAPLRPGERVPGVARYVSRLGIEAMTGGGVLARAAWRFVGPYVPIGEPDVRTKAYGVLDVGATIPLGGTGLRADLDLQNVLDDEYPEIRASGFISPGAPRMLLVALRFNP